jgi:hypothetical protein
MKQERDSKGRFVSSIQKSSQEEGAKFIAEKIESKKYPLSGAYFTVERGGQEHPCKNDKIFVRLTIYLPSSGKYLHLKNDIVFAYRVKVSGENLHATWGFGKKEIEGYRYTYKNFSDEKWKDAFEEAAEYGRTEIEKLEDALRKRAKALEDAEK